MVLALTGLALPHADVALWRAVTSGFWAAVSVVVVALAATALAVAWFCLAWSGTPGWRAADALCATAFLVGCSFVILGTRPTARLLLPLVTPLLSLPVVSGRPLALALLVTALAVVVVVELHRSRPGRSQEARVDPLPRLLPAAAVLLLLGLLLAVVSMRLGIHPDGAALVRR